MKIIRDSLATAVLFTGFAALVGVFVAGGAMLTGAVFEWASAGGPAIELAVVAGR